MATIAQDEGKSLVARAMDAVKAHIRVAGMRVGDTLPGEGFFAEQLGVSRAVMREAFGALAALKVIDVANGRRAKVGALDGSVIAASLDHGLSTEQIKVADVWDVRRTIEMRTAALAARNATTVQAARIVALADAMGVQRKHVNQLCKGRRSVTAPTALILARVFGNSPEFWLNVQRRSDVWEAMNSPDQRARIKRARPLKSAA